MFARPSETANTPWQGDPERDLVIHRLIEMGHRALGQYFSDANHRAAYQMRMRGKKGKKTAASPKPEVLDVWMAGEATRFELLAQPETLRFALRVEAENFKAEVAMTYEPDLGDLLGAWVVYFKGNSEALRAAAGSFKEKFTDELSDLDLDLADSSHERLLPLANKPRFPATRRNDAAGPTEVTEQDIKRVTHLATTLAADLKQGELVMPEPSAQTYLAAKPQCLWPILEGFLSACHPVNDAEQDEDLKGAYQILLANQLELVRYRSERGWEWADEMIEAYQLIIKEIAKGGKLSTEDLFALAAALTEAKVPLDPKVREVFLKSRSSALPLSFLRSEPCVDVIRSEIEPLIIKLAERVDNPFQVVEGLNEATKLIPPGMLAFLVYEFALSTHVVLRDAVPLMLLDPEAEVRQAATAALELMAKPDTLSPVGLRRAIILRNWIPEDERGGLDRAIKKARTKGVACAQWITSPQLSILGMPIDGSGVHGFIVTTKPGTSGPFGGILCKQAFGLRDIWCEAKKPREAINQALAGVRNELASIEVERDYLDAIVQHYLNVGLSNGSVPTPDLLAIAELIGAAEWRPAHLEIDTEIEGLVSELSLGDISPEKVSASLKCSGRWLSSERFARSWFIGDAEATSVVMGSSKRKGDAALKAIFEVILERRRPFWAEKFLLMALWARAGKAQKDRQYWPDFLILARELATGRPLNEIPIMKAIAERSISIAGSGLPS